MKASDIVKSMAWAAAGAVFVAGGMVFGRIATLVEQQGRGEQRGDNAPPEPPTAPHPNLGRRVRSEERRVGKECRL